MSNLTSLSAIQQESVLLTISTLVDIVNIADIFPFLILSAKEQKALGCKYCWDIYGNCFPYEETLGYVNPTPVRCSRPFKKPTFWNKVVKILNHRLF